MSTTTAEPRSQLEVDADPQVDVEGTAGDADGGREDAGDGGRRPWWRRRPWLTAVVALVLLLGALAATATAPLLDVDRIEVRGAYRQPVEEVLARSGLGEGQAMVGLDDDGAAARVEGLPWVDRATVERSWPGEVVIEVVEREPVAALVTGRRRWVVVDAEGQRLEQVRSPDPPSTAVRGVPGEAGPPGTAVGERAAGAVALAALLPDSLRMRRPAVEVEGEGRLVMALTVDRRRVTAVFGRPEQLREKVISLATVIDTVDAEGLARIDLRRPTEPVLTREVTPP